MKLSVSIIIPIHNRAHTLKKCIDSILSQTYEDFELILVDDHSTDSSLRICKEYFSNDLRIKVFNQSDEKHGAQAARNTGIKNAKHDWIMFNDSDDVWHKDKIKKELDVLEQYGYDEQTVIYSDCNTINVDTNEKNYWALPHIDEKKSYKDLLVKSGPMFQSLLCSKKHLEEIGYLDESVPSYQEWDTSIRLAKNGRFVHIKEPLFDYYVGANDTISKSIGKDFIGRCNIYNKFKDEIIKTHGEKQYKRMMALCFSNAKDNVDFEILKKQNQIIKKYEDNLIELFGKDYKNKINKCTKDTNLCKVKTKISNLLHIPFYKIPGKIFRKMYPQKKESYQDKIKRSIKKYASKVYFNQEGNGKLLELLSRKKPVFITRFGSVELNTLNEFTKGKNYSESTFVSMRNNAGFFPITRESLDGFAKLYFESIKNIDCCGVWFNDGEAKILKDNVPSALLVELSCLNSFLYDNPYTQILRNKNILVIHPFVNSIQYQLANNRTKLFSNPNVLPECNINLIKAPQTIAGNTDGYGSWFEALEDTKKKIAECNFDIALLGCGAYGLPLGAYIKSLGKTAIHIGGALQLFFGIKGRRWETEYNYGETIFNEHWIYPLDTDIPFKSNEVENNCYWK